MQRTIGQKGNKVLLSFAQTKFGNKQMNYVSRHRIGSFGLAQQELNKSQQM